MSNFKYELGRAEYPSSENTYQILYCGGDGRQVEHWREESAIGAMA